MQLTIYLSLMEMYKNRKSLAEKFNNLKKENLKMSPEKHV